jgi:hypothetical protein
VVTVIVRPAGSWKLIRLDTADDWTRLATSGANALSPIAEFEVRDGERTKVEILSRPDHRDEKDGLRNKND